MAWGWPNILTQFHLSLPQPGAASHHPPLQCLLPRLWLRLPGCHLLQAPFAHAFRHHQPGERTSGGPRGWGTGSHADLRQSSRGEAVSSWRLVTWPSCFSTLLSLISNSMFKQCLTVFQMSLINDIYLSFIVLSRYRALYKLDQPPITELSTSSLSYLWEFYYYFMWGRGMFCLLLLGQRRVLHGRYYPHLLPNCKS